MKDTEYDVFDQLLEDALASDAVPSDDFTARLMEQVRRTPQERPRHMRPALKVLAALAACAVIAAAIPLAMPRMGSAADSSAAAADTANGMGGAVKQYAADDAENNMMVGSAPDGDAADRKEKSGDTPETVTLTGADAQKAQSVLADMSLQPFDQEDSATVYELTAEQAAALGEQVDALYGIEGACTLILEDIK